MGAEQRRLTTADEILAVLAPGERISYSTLLGRLEKPEGMLFALDDPRIEMRWRTGEPARLNDGYGDESFNKGPLFVARVPA